MQLLPIHPSIQDQLNEFHQSGNVPNILFYGPIGCGKSTLIHHFIRQIYQDDMARIKKFTLYIDCTQFKGIKFIREDLKFFAQSNFTGENTFKIIILQNADKLTIDAQSALRRCIEIYIHSTRFFIDITDKEGLIKPILSRFCSIHVPAPTICGKHGNKAVPVNLYKYKMELSDDKNVRATVASNRHDNIRKKVQKMLQASASTNTHASESDSVFEMAEYLYQSGIHCLDIIRLIENGLLVQNNLAMQHDLLFTFSHWQKEIRSEKIIMATLLQCIITHRNIVASFEVV